LDLDLRARIRLVLDLIRIVHARSDDQGRAGPRAAALLAGDGVPAAAHGWGSPDRAKFGHLGMKSSAARL
jgi:hypothetical protein